jgi:hypothetical protein
MQTMKGNSEPDCNFKYLIRVTKQPTRPTKALERFSYYLKKKKNPQLSVHSYEGNEPSLKHAVLSYDTKQKLEIPHDAAFLPR